MLPATVDLYGFIELNMGYEHGQNDPDWFDVARPSKLPAQADEFGHDGRTFASVRPSRLGLKAGFASPLGDVTTTLEADAFGSDQNVGETAFRLRLASIELPHFGAGLTWSPFTDTDISSGQLEFFGPAGVVWLRNVLMYWRPLTGETRFTIALERPGATGDGGIYADRIELEGVRLRFPLPDLSAEFRVARQWGYVKVGGVVRTIQIDAQSPAASAPETRVHGWGFQLSAGLDPTPDDKLHVQAVYGQGIENYINDAPVDVAARTNGAGATAQVGAQALPVLGLTAFLDHDWGPRWATTLGYSLERITNSNAQTPAAFHRGDYALINLVHTPTPGLKFGAELQFVRRDNASDGFSVNDLRLQLTVRLDFSASL